MNTALNFCFFPCPEFSSGKQKEKKESKKVPIKELKIDRAFLLDYVFRVS